MYKKYRIIILTICTLTAIMLALTIEQALYSISSKGGGNLFELLFVGIAIISFFLNLITPIYVIIGDLIYILKKNNMPRILKILDVVLIIQIWSTFVLLSGFSSTPFSSTLEGIIYKSIFIPIWILQIVFTLRWKTDSKK